jgi:hypothetical protein
MVLVGVVVNDGLVTVLGDRTVKVVLVVVEVAAFGREYMIISCLFTRTY